MEGHIFTEGSDNLISKEHLKGYREQLLGKARIGLGKINKTVRAGKVHTHDEKGEHIVSGGVNDSWGRNRLFEDILEELEMEEEEGGNPRALLQKFSKGQRRFGNRISPLGEFRGYSRRFRQMREEQL